MTEQTPDTPSVPDTPITSDPPMTTEEETPSGDTTDETTGEPDWASALAEQEAGHDGATQADGLVGADDWASALAEQTAASTKAPPSSTGKSSQPDTAATAVPAHDVFQPLTGDGALNDSDIDLIMDIPVQLSVELGRTKLTIRNILQLGQGSVVELDGLAGEPMDIFVNGYLIAQGEVVVVDDRYGIRLTDIITPADRLSRLNGRR